MSDPIRVLIADDHAVLREGLRSFLELQDGIEIVGDDGRDQLQSLTPREREVLELIGRGFSNKRIALELGLAEKTVKTHVTHVLGKLGVADRTQAAIYAARHRS